MTAAVVLAWLLRPDPVPDAAAALRTAGLTISGEIEGNSVRGEGQVDLPADRAALELAESAPGLEHARGEGVEIVLVGDRSYRRERFKEYDFHGNDLGRWRRSSGTGGFDPRELLRALRSPQDVEEVGEEDVRRQATTRYRATIRTAARRERVDVWVDDRGRLARVDARGVSVFVDHGEPVHIAEPEVEEPTP